MSTRTIYRYVDDLSLSGIPIYGEAGVGYALDEHFELPPLALNRDELDALLLGVELISRTVGDEMADAARSLLSKIQAAVPEHALDPQSARCGPSSAPSPRNSCVTGTACVAPSASRRRCASIT